MFHMGEIGGAGARRIRATHGFREALINASLDGVQNGNGLSVNQRFLNQRDGLDLDEGALGQSGDVNG
jgi:hypothetical protein